MGSVQNIQTREAAWEMPKSRRRKQWLLLLVVNVAVLLLAFSPYLRTMFSSDSYAHIQEADGLNYMAHLWLGRPVSYALMAILYHLGVRVTSHQLLMKLILLVCSAISAVVLTQLFARVTGRHNTKTLVFANMAVLFSFINIFIQEFYYFPEATPVFGFGLLFTALSIWFFFRKPTIPHMLLALLFLTLSMGMYQVMVQLYIGWGMCFWLVSSRFTFNKKAVMRFLQLVVVCVVASAITMAVLWLFQTLGIAPVTDRNLSLSALGDNLGILFVRTQAFLWGLWQFVPLNWLVAVVFLVLFGLLVFVMVRRKVNVAGWLMLLFTLFANYVSVFLLHAFTEVVWAVPRTLVGFYSLFTTVALLLLYWRPAPKLRRSAAAVMALLLAFGVYHIAGFAMAQRANNTADAQIAREVRQEVLRYEQESGISVEKMVVGKDTYPQYEYPENAGYIYGDQNYRVWQNFWSSVAAYNYYAGSDLQVVYLTDGVHGIPHDVYAMYFEGKDWDTFDAREQLVFEGDTLYMVAY